MRYHIDRFSAVAGVVVVVGWCDAFTPGRNITMTHAGLDMQTTFFPVARPDVALVVGEGAHWGFRAYAACEDAAPDMRSIGLRVGDAAIENVASVLPALPGGPHELWASFVANMNDRGGLALELGSRDRWETGNTFRSWLDGGVRYLGVDLISGPNVDIACDAHELSRHINEPVDFIFSHSVFEHLMMPWKVALEANKVLKPGGRIYCASHQTWPGHDEPWDYWRFSENGWSGLFNSHTGFRIVDARQGEPVSVIAHWNAGGPYQNMDRGRGFGMSCCVAEKIGDPMVEWVAPMSAAAEMIYAH